MTMGLLSLQSLITHTAQTIGDHAPVNADPAIHQSRTDGSHHQRPLS
jgi:hypothetical protein